MDTDTWRMKRGQHSASILILPTTSRPIGSKLHQPLRHGSGTPWAWNWASRLTTVSPQTVSSSDRRNLRALFNLEVILDSSRRLHSHIRITSHPAARNSELTNLSRSEFFFNFLDQNSKFDFGMRLCRGQPCQKHPSTKSAIFALRNTKSGLPGNRSPLRQPVIRVLRSISTIFSSVDRLPFPRTFDIRMERSSIVSVSAICYLGGCFAK